MTTITTSTNAVLARIHETGYWRVLMHPSQYEERRIRTLAECEDLIEASTVSLRGWTYPYSERIASDAVHGDSYIQHSVDWANYLELWRFYQSGQFVHQFAFHWDRIGPWGPGTPGQIKQGSRVLGFLDVVYTLTEILALVRKLAYRGVFDPVVNIRVELHGTENRQLTGTPDRQLHDRHIAAIDEITWCSSQPAAVVIADAPRLAIDAAMHIFERFNWPDPPRVVFEEDQWRLLERRL